MSRKKPTPTEREARAEQRRTLREKAAEKVEELREWREARGRIAEERAAEKRRVHNSRPRGVDRVPEHLAKGNPLQRPPRTASTKVTDRTPGRQYGDERTPRYPRSSRRRTPRRRDMPGAVARRLERNRKAWSQ